MKKTTTPARHLPASPSHPVPWETVAFSCAVALGPYVLAWALLAATSGLRS